MKNSNKSIVNLGRKVIKTEALALNELADRLNGNFDQAVDVLFKVKRKVIVTGVGKSGLIGQKIAATLTSTGTPAFFLHPTDALHGDLGLVRKGDAAIIISKSGETDELYELLSVLKRVGVKIIALLGKLDSPLAGLSDVVLDVSVKEEACPHDLVPTSSTTAALAMGDALAVALLDQRNFSPEDFACFHPGGGLGKRLLLKVSDLMLTGKDVPIVASGSGMKEALIEMTAKRGVTSVVDEKGRLLGIITDGDLKRLLARTNDIFSLKVDEVIGRNPKTVDQERLAVKAAKMMEDHRVTSLLVVDKEKKPVGIIHLHDIMQAGVL
ncbi:MAG: D-arabinose 5-phosphate isomerase [Candidatus Edwardsbacteria bacterium RIFOXYD12_FULL_50_11]|uniref:D-arabinose 5-phosphate isomerase n=1 Tax=Candidatus Edwardsbacteria bacterium GWF2_54_11 TaxID=1817851 RepID=A0A1F5RGC4_9BACT|nr:MAG: D-arabinose 5-phosphate isomerase [Candidatus Edwardsbacteria bacterium RifOxyC12_full_54_24]OGF06066.1 MAG: D-arabinose 5-phosphate isomerase [Candidatus Edwardsbacteria bacterium RifOxyA12_full_54_48]OGF11873.1 MAG: D-arabinose 5-phosphate isomerase [Candidatus Edwardsbacteria bacterium GWE2_54_12]OGF13496.1 MAG: D-arabinose 5-phosphate isomerase [Candidatus Edwardsbacteria bacterium GWF2_54_11]OGF17107.1 MAG: D-arabinose 5-phosphate isomerase [Candidatus Edwardsbacteria bacterium RIF